jgi:methoxymalonate biosynthesis acyl carrier protein
MENVKEKTRSFLGKYFDTTALGDDADIFATGQVNSMFALQLVMFLEKEFGTAVDNTDLGLDNFRSITAIAEFVKRKSAK